MDAGERVSYTLTGFSRYEVLSRACFVAEPLLISPTCYIVALTVNVNHSAQGGWLDATAPAPKVKVRPYDIANWRVVRDRSCRRRDEGADRHLAERPAGRCRSAPLIGRGAGRRPARACFPTLVDVPPGRGRRRCGPLMC